MRLGDILWFSTSNLTHRGLRSWLTILGVVVGIAAVVAIVGMGEGMEASVSSQIQSFGADTITVSPGYSRATGLRFGPHVDTAAATDEEGLTDKDENVLRSLPGVAAVMGVVSERAEVSFLTEEAQLTVEGADPLVWKEFKTVEIDTGRLLAPGDTYMAVVGSDIASEVYSQPITTSRQIIINNKTFVVVGTLSPSTDGVTDSKIIVPIDGARQIVEDIEEDEYSLIQIKAAPDVDLGLMEEVVTETLLISRGVIPEEQDFTVRSSLQMQSRFSEIMDTMITSLAGIAAVSLLVGAIGIANTMYTSVIERTRQIGVLKAIGATNGDVMVVFLIESGLVGLMGGVFGVIVGALVSSILTGSGVGILPLPGRMGGASAAAIISPELVIEALLFSLAVGIISGVFPARLASNLQPVEALRYE